MESTLSGTTIYREHQSFWLLNVIVLVVACALVLMAALTGTFPGNIHADAVPALVGGLLVAALALWGFSRLNVKISATDVQFGFPIWHRRIPVSAIYVGEIVRIPLWYGIGLHYAGGMWVYNARLGRGLIIAINGKRYLIGSDNPERLQAALLQVAPRRKPA